MAVNARFSLDNPAETETVVVICQRLDGIPLAIELAAARMVSMSALDVQDRLDDRFRLLAGGRRGIERHQTLRQAVGWSYDLLDENERFVLNRCAVFSGGFSVVDATHLCQPLDEYVVLDVLDSLVRKSLVTVEQVYGRVRYGLYETIRQFAEEQLAGTDDIGAVRDAHARCFAEEAMSYWEVWDGPGQRVALEWLDAEFANLRAGFRWAADHHDLDTATSIAAHTPFLALLLERFEPVGWAQELLDAATAADVRQLPRLYAAASMAVISGGARRPSATPRPPLPWTPSAATTASRPVGAVIGRPSLNCPLPDGWSAVWRSAPRWSPRQGGSASSVLCCPCGC